MSTVLYIRPGDEDLILRALFSAADDFQFRRSNTTKAIAATLYEYAEVVIEQKEESR